MKRSTAKKSTAQGGKTLDNTKYATIDIGDDTQKTGLTYAYNEVSLDDYDTPAYAFGTKITEKSLVPPGTYKFQAKLLFSDFQPA